MTKKYWKFIAIIILSISITSCLTISPKIEVSKQLDGLGMIVSEPSYHYTYDKRVAYLEEVIPGAITAAYGFTAIQSDANLTDNELYIGMGVLVGSYFITKTVIDRTRRQDTIILVDSADFQEWFDLYNSVNKGKYVIADSAFYKQKKVPILIEKSQIEKYNQLKDSKKFTLSYTPRSYETYTPVDKVAGLSNFSKEYFLTKLENGVHLANTLKDYEAAYSVTYHRSELLNGYTNAVFYQNENDDYASAVYVGDFVNGMPDGLGIMSYKDSILGYRRTYRGLFSEGKYAYMDIAMKYTKDFLNSDMARNYYQLPKESDVSIDIVSANFQQDYIDNRQFNEYEIVSKISWKDEKRTDRYLLYKLTREDFYQLPKFIFVSGDKQSTDIWKKFTKEKEADFLENIIDFFISADDYYYEENVYVSRGMWIGYGYNSCGGGSDGWFSSYNEDASRDVTVYTRLNPISDWEKIGTWELYRVCEDEFLDTWRYTTNVDDSSTILQKAVEALFNLGYSTEQEALNEIVEDALRNVKHPQDRKTIEQANAYKDAMFRILKRAELSGLYEMNQNDFKVGVWQSAKGAETLFIGRDGRLFLMPTDMISLLNKDSYMTESLLYQIINSKDSELTVIPLDESNAPNEYIDYKIINENMLQIGNNDAIFDRVDLTKL
jgi:hypothetical protein